MKIEIGKRYVTRDGNITYPMEPYHHGNYEFRARMPNGDWEVYTEYGNYWASCDVSHFDLISEYKPTMTKGYKYYTDNADLRQFLVDQCLKMGFKRPDNDNSFDIGVSIDRYTGEYDVYCFVKGSVADRTKDYPVMPSVEEFLSKAKEFIQKSVTVPLSSEYMATWNGGDTLKVGYQSIEWIKYWNWLIRFGRHGTYRD